MRRIIRIFLASSIVELANERMAIENFIRNISDKFEENYDVKIQPLLCENFDDAYSITRKQEEYNDKIRDSELCFFIFFTKAGEYTREEFEVARKKFEETGKPKIYTYFKVIKDGEAEQSLTDFMNELDKVFGHYYGTFDHIDTVKLRILLSLKLQEMDFLEIKTENGNCIVDGKAVMQLDNVSEFMNNKTLEKLREELQKVEEEYYQLKPIYAKGNCDNEFYRHYSNIASKRQNLIDEIEKLQELIFNVSLQMSYDNVHGEVTVRQKEAYRLFELGDYDGCMAVLDSKDIDDDFLRERKRIKEQDVAVCRKYIKEHKTAIDILQTMKGYNGRFSEIEERYEKIIDIAFEHEEIKTVYSYILYLSEQNKHHKAISLCEKLIGLMASRNNIFPELYIVLGRLYNEQNESERAETAFLKAQEKVELLSNNPTNEQSILSREYLMVDLARCFISLGDFYISQKKFKKAEEYSFRALVILENLERNCDYLIAECYYNIGRLYFEREKYKAHKYFVDAITLLEPLAFENPEQYSSLLIVCYNAISSLLISVCRVVGFSCNSVDAVDYIKKSISLSEKLSKENFQKFSSDLAFSYCLLAKQLDTAGLYEYVKNYFNKALDIYVSMAKESPKKFGGKVAQTQFELACFCLEQKEMSEAEFYCLEALKRYEYLEKDNEEKFELSSALCNYTLGLIYSRKGVHIAAKNYYLGALSRFEAMVKKSARKYEPYVAITCMELALIEKRIFKRYKWMCKAIWIAQEYPQNKLCIPIISLVKNRTPFIRPKISFVINYVEPYEVINDDENIFNGNINGWLIDEIGDEGEYEFITSVAYDDEKYIVLLPVEESDEAGEVVILKEQEHKGKKMFVSVDDDQTLETVFEIFKTKFADEFNFID